MTRNARRGAGWVMGLLLGCASAAQAATLVTPPLFTDNGDVLTCMITNAGKKSVDVTIEAVNAAGGVVTTSSTTIEPGTATFLNANTTFTTTICRFTVNGGKRSVRAAACIRATSLVPCGTTVTAQ